jgi:S2P endopeptidase
MSLGTLALSLTILWLAIHALDRLVRTHHRKHASILPSTSARNNINTTHVTLHHIHLRIQTTTLNSTHERLSSAFSTKRFERLRNLLCWFYDLGSGVGVVGMVVGVSVLVWTVGELVGVSVGRKMGRRVVKRALDAAQPRTSLLNPIVSSFPFIGIIIVIYISCRSQG